AWDALACSTASLYLSGRGLGSIVPAAWSARHRHSEIEPALAVRLPGHDRDATERAAARRAPARRWLLVGLRAGAGLCRAGDVGRAVRPDRALQARHSTVR